MSEPTNKSGATIPDKAKKDVNFCPNCGGDIANCKTETWDKCPYDDCGIDFKVSMK